MKREILSMNSDWRFHLGDLPYVDDNVPGDKDKLYLSAKTEASKGAARRDYDDSDWRVLTLPHDYVVEGTPTPEASGFFGSLKRENAWYRKTFKLAQGDQGKRLALHFDGVCTACQVHVNGIPMMRNFTAGIGFDVDITDIARYGEDVNVVAVHVDNSDFEGWYYEGGGIYRNVWLVKSGKVYVDLWGTFVQSKPIQGNDWFSQIETEVCNIYNQSKLVQVLSEIVDSSGILAASVMTEATILPNSVATVGQSMLVSGVKRWDIDDPNLYTLKTTLFMEGHIEDDYITTIGYRSIAFTANDGFFLNDRRVQIIGYGSHQDLTGFGIGITDAIQEFRMRRLKEMGFNLFRTAHNPHAPSVYDACNRLGLLCMEENRWFSSAPQAKDEVIRMLKRGRNHPSIIMWSLFNEECIKATTTGSNIFRSLAALVHRYDPTRPAMGADNVAIALPETCEELDVIGINHYYDEESIDKSRKLYPDKPVFFSEIGLTEAIRKIVNDRPHILGAVGWGGLPYRGETVWPQLFSGSDSRYPYTLICGSTDLFYKHQSTWANVRMVKIGGHWNHETPGKMIPVTVYTSCECAELFLNGKSLGEKAVDRFDCEAVWEVPFQAGELKAVAKCKDEKPLIDVIVTVGNPAQIGWKLENPCICNSGLDTAIITLSIRDDQGRDLPLSEDYLLKIRAIEGGRVLCVGSPNRGDDHSWQVPEIYTCNAKAQVYVSCDCQPGSLVLEVCCDAFETLAIEIKKKTVPTVPMVPAEDCRFIYMWYISPTLIDQPWPEIDAVRKSAELSKWKHVEISRGNNDEFTGLYERFGIPPTDPHPPKESARVIYHATGIIPRYHEEFQDLWLLFERFEGIGEITLYSGAKKTTIRKDCRTEDWLQVNVSGFAPGDPIEIWCVLEANNNFSSISRPVHWVFSEPQRK